MKESEVRYTLSAWVSTIEDEVAKSNVGVQLVLKRMYE
jgi:hypothetical protein